jgi:hypothetical protein
MTFRSMPLAIAHRRAPGASMRVRIGGPGGIDQAFLHVLK